MKKIIALMGAFFAVSVFAATVTVAVAPEEVTIDSTIRKLYLQHFTARFFHAAKLYNLPPFSETEKQHLEAAASRFVDGSFQVFKKNNLIDTITKIENDPQIEVFMQKMLQAATQEDILAAARGLGDYLHEQYPAVVKAEISADLKASKLAFLKEVETIPSMPKLAEKSAFTFWSTVLTPGLR